MNKLISVIMCTYNESEKWIKEAVESILKQTYTNFEFIITVDDPNNKNMIKLLNNYKNQDKRIIIVVNKKNIGLVASLNNALKKANGEYIARMDADDISYHNRLEKQVKYLEEEKEVDLVGTGIDYINEKGDFIYTAKIYGKNIKLAKKSLKYSNIIAHPTWMFRKSIIKKVHGYNEIKFAEDYDFLLRLINSNLNVKNLNEVLLKYRKRNQSISASNSYQQFITWKLLKENNYNIEKINNYSKIDERKYINSDELLKKGIESFKKRKYIKAINYLIKSSVKSKHRFYQIKSLLILNLINLGD